MSRGHKDILTWYGQRNKTKCLAFKWSHSHISTDTKLFKHLLTLHLMTLIE